MDMEPDFTLDELFEQLTDNTGAPDGYHTSYEWGELLGVNHGRMMAILHKLKRQGRLVLAQQKRVFMDGREGHVPTYAIQLDRKE